MPQALKSIVPLVAHLASSHCGIYVRVRSRPTAGVRTSGGLKVRLPALDTLLEIRRTLTGGTEARGDVTVDQSRPELTWSQSHTGGNAKHARAATAGLALWSKCKWLVCFSCCHRPSCGIYNKRIAAVVLICDQQRLDVLQYDGNKIPSCRLRIRRIVSLRFSRSCNRCGGAPPDTSKEDRQAGSLEAYGDLGITGTSRAEIESRCAN